MKSLDIVIPCLNEERQLPLTLETLRRFCSADMSSYRWRLVVADNGSNDDTLAVAEDFASRFPSVIATVHLPERGRGRALRKAWTESNADYVCYMDVDLSTDLRSLPQLIHSVAWLGYDVAIGSRLMDQSIVEKRSLKREIISRAYNLLIKLTFQTRFHDAQCGFKALSRKAVHEILPLVKDSAWFFDTEILLLAEKQGYRVKEVPVRWTDDPDTRVRVLKTAWEDVKGLWRLRVSRIPAPITKINP